MIYLEKIKFKENYRNFKKGDTITFSDITLLVGDQGEGKSTILSLLSNNNKNILELMLSDFTIKNGVKTYYFDTEKMNPRIQDIDSVTNIDGTDRGIGVGGLLVSKFKSHGEVLENLTVNLLEKAKDSVIFLDEPESALSLRNQYKLVKNIELAKKNNCQLIISTHCLPLIENNEKIFNVNNLKWVESKKYINKFKKKYNEKKLKNGREI